MNSVPAQVALLATLACAAAGADGFTVDPAQLQLRPGTAHTSIKVTNTGSTPELLQITVLRWTHIDGQDAYQSEPGAMVSPPMFRLAPGESRKVHIRFNRVPPATVARAWKVTIEEPAAITPVSTSPAHPRFSQSLPLLLQPAWPRHALHWTAERNGHALQLSADNGGNAIERIDRLSLAAVEGRPTYCALRGPIYLFPGETHDFSLPIHTDRQPSDTLKLLMRGTTTAVAELALGPR